ncbi:MAG: hypothetical protein EBT73_01375 [Actinobacteria bacterium]|nr:hypothetical protein [Actinomycetota bacterium]
MVAGPSKRRARHLVFLPYFVFLALFLIWPATFVFVRAFQQGDAPRNPMIEAMTGQFRGAFVYSLQISLSSAAIGLVVGSLVAVAIVRLDHVRALRSTVVGYSSVAANMGGIPLAFAFIAAFGMQGLATRLLREVNIDLIGWGFRITDFWGIVLVYLYFQIPLMTLVLVPALDGLRRTWQEAAQSLGASCSAGFSCSLQMRFRHTPRRMRCHRAVRVSCPCRSGSFCKEIRSPAKRTLAMPWPRGW